MNVFEKHGIKHLSPSSLRLYREEPAAWCIRYLLGVKDEAGPGAWRGQAVEAAVDRHLFKESDEVATKAMQDEFEKRAAGLADDKTAAERADLGAFFAQAKLALTKVETPLTRQSKISIDLPGIEVPVIGFVDYEWPDYGLDLKTTRRLPSQPDPSHVEQVAVYSEAKGKPFSLLYVTPKKYAVYPVTSDMAADAMVRVRRGAAALRSLLARCSSGEDALSIFSPDMASYHWSPEMVIAAKRIYDGAPA
jgi:hypothetical protein